MQTTKETGTMGMIYELDDTEKEVLMNEAIKRARADLNDGRPLTEMRKRCECHKFIRLSDGNCPVHGFVRKQVVDPSLRTLSEEQRELFNEATSLAYSAIRHSGLWRSLTNEQWDAKAATYGWLVVELLNNLINEDLTALEAESEAQKANE